VTNAIFEQLETLTLVNEISRTVERSRGIGGKLLAVVRRKRETRREGALCTLNALALSLPRRCLGQLKKISPSLSDCFNTFEAHN
jgi:hypothetical protein